ncbi:MAG TPA: DNA-3-methyladenine glycosylase, partial [Minicystis sp.]|nr:DNA-3-methyladenine glycosylase [Minicystis sp.]
AELIARVGPCKLGAHTLGPFERHDYFSGLVEAIVSQQLSAKAADTIFRRVVAAVGPTFDAASLARIPEPALREAGLSGAKARYVRGLADEVLAGRLRLDRLDAMTDDEVVDELSRLKGIGRWTAEMILMFHLRRLDVLPVDDLGIQKGMMRLFGLRKLPAKARMEKLARPWRPYRSVACWYLWRLNELPAPAPKRRASRA